MRREMMSLVRRKDARQCSGREMYTVAVGRTRSSEATVSPRPALTPSSVPRPRHRRSVLLCAALLDTAGSHRFDPGLNPHRLPTFRMASLVRVSPWKRARFDQYPVN